MNPHDTKTLAGIAKAIGTTAEQAAENLAAFNAEAAARAVDGERPVYVKPRVKFGRNEASNNPVVQELRQRMLGRTAPSWANRAAAEIDRLERQHAVLLDENRWLVATMKWLSSPENKGGITTCRKHNGHGFQSDCAICTRLSAIDKTRSQNSAFITNEQDPEMNNAAKAGGQQP